MTIHSVDDVLSAARQRRPILEVRTAEAHDDGVMAIDGIRDDLSVEHIASCKRQAVLRIQPFHGTPEGRRLVAVVERPADRVPPRLPGRSEDDDAHIGSPVSAAQHVVKAAIANGKLPARRSADPGPSDSACTGRRVRPRSWPDVMGRYL